MARQGPSSTRAVARAVCEQLGAPVVRSADRLMSPPFRKRCDPKGAVNRQMRVVDSDSQFQLARLQYRRRAIGRRLPLRSAICRRQADDGAAVCESHRPGRLVADGHREGKPVGTVNVDRSVPRRPRSDGDRVKQLLSRPAALLVDSGRWDDDADRRSLHLKREHVPALTKGHLPRHHMDLGEPRVQAYVGHMQIGLHVAERVGFDDELAADEYRDTGPVEAT